MGNNFGGTNLGFSYCVVNDMTTIKSQTYQYHRCYLQPHAANIKENGK